MKTSSRQLKVCVLGGTGFVGTEVVARLAAAGHFVRVPTRLRSRGNHLLVLPTVEVLAANVHEPRVLSELLDGIDAIVNLIGIVNEKAFGREEFRGVHTDLASKVVDAARGARVRRLLHMSALGADPANAPSQYLRSKGAAEKHVLRAKDVDATIFRPSVIFGPRDSLTNRFARLLRLSNGFMPLARARARFAPIYVEDVAEAFLRVLSDRKTFGEIYELCGPRVMTLKDIVRFTAESAGLSCHVLPLPDVVARLQGAIMGLLPGKPFSLDNFKSLTIDSVCRENGCERLGIRPKHMEAITPTYLGDQSMQARLSRYRWLNLR